MCELFTFLSEMIGGYLQK